VMVVVVLLSSVALGLGMHGLEKWVRVHGLERSFDWSCIHCNVHCTILRFNHPPICVVRLPMLCA